MSKSGVIVLIIAAVVFCGLGFVIGQVVQASGANPGSEGDPAITQSYVDKLVGARVSALQEEIDELKALMGQTVTPVAPTDPPTTTDPGPTDPVTIGGQKVKSTTDGLNVRSSASTSGTVLTSVSTGTEMEYLGSATASDGAIWYNVKLSNGTVGYVHSDYCSAPY